MGEAKFNYSYKEEKPKLIKCFFFVCKMKSDQLLIFTR